MSALRLPPELAAWAELAAELVNTRPRSTDPSEKLVGPAELARLLSDCPERPPAVSEHDLVPMRELRPRLLGAFEAPTMEAFSAAINPLLALNADAWQLGRAGRGDWALGPKAGKEPAAWFGARAAHGLAALAITYGIERLHICAADDCRRAVVDVSGNGTRRYCSRTCANRTNVRRHRRRH